MAGERHIRIDKSATPIQDPPRRVPVALQEKVKQKLEEQSQQGIIESVTTPTRWISSKVEVVKNGKLITNLPGSKTAEQSHSTRTLPSAQYRNKVARREGVHQVGRQERFLAREVGRRIIVPDHVQLAIWPLSLETNAIRYHAVQHQKYSIAK